MKEILFSPPVVFLIVFVFMRLLSRLLSGFSFSPKQKTAGGGESYACGEDNYEHRSQPNYSQFFSFAFFFTIAHVATLMLATVPQHNPRILVMALIYIVAVIVGLSIFLRSR